VIRAEVIGAEVIGAEVIGAEVIGADALKFRGDSARIESQRKGLHLPWCHRNRPWLK